MKKLLVLLTAAMISTSVACGKKETTTVKKGTEVVEVENGKKDSSSKDDQQEHGGLIEFDTSGSIEETVLYDQEDIKITAISLNYIKEGAKLKIQIENNTEETLTFVGGASSETSNIVNNCNVNTGKFSLDVKPGKVGNDTCKFYYDDLIVSGITGIKEIGLDVRVRDEEYDDVLITGPMFVKTSIFDSYDTSNDSLSKIIENKGLIDEYLPVNLDYSEDLNLDLGDVEGTAAAVFSDKKGEKFVLIEFFNNSDEIRRVGIEDFLLNGYSVRAGCTGLVSPHCSNVISVNLKYAVDDGMKDIVHYDNIQTIGLTAKSYDEDFDAIGSEYCGLVIDESAIVSTNEVEGEMILDKNDIVLTYVGFEQKKRESVYRFILENNNDYEIDADIQDGTVSLDNVMCSGYSYFNDVPANGKIVMTLSISNKSLLEADIENIEDVKAIEFELEVKDDEYDDVLDEMVTVNLEEE